MKYIIAIDQSTQATKAVLFDEKGRFVGRADRRHKQIIMERGWVSHDLTEIYENTLQSVREVVDKTGIDAASIAAVGISNQRETTALWDKSGNPLAHAVVWQCARAKEITERLQEEKEMVREKTGLSLSPYYPASKMAWLLTHIQPKEPFCLGTMDSWLIYKLTDGMNFYTDYSNASRTQLFNLHTLCWDQELCHLFGIPMTSLPEVMDSNACFGYTDFGGFLNKKIPIHGVMGDSHSALFGQRCHCKGMAKATYGTGSSIMMNIGSTFAASHAGLATSLAWKIDGKAAYVLEGNIHYAGAVISWLQNDLKLISSAKEAEELAAISNPEDGTVLVPAFTGLSAPYWKEDAKAVLWGMSRTTGRAEIAKAALDSIAFQVMDVLNVMERDSACSLEELCVDGGPAKNSRLMQFQSDIAKQTLRASKQEELSAIGVAYLAGMAAGISKEEEIFGQIEYDIYTPTMDSQTRIRCVNQWNEALSAIL